MCGSATFATEISRISMKAARATTGAMTQGWMFCRALSGIVLWRCQRGGGRGLDAFEVVVQDPPYLRVDTCILSSVDIGSHIRGPDRFLRQRSSAGIVQIDFNF